MSKLEKNLKEWVCLGFIDSEQAKRIEQHSSLKVQKSWILSNLLLLGIMIIGMGIISLIAANWDTIPSSFKLILDFTSLIAVAIGISKSQERKQWICFEALLLFFLILCFASIALIVQIYHMKWEFYQILNLGAAITFGVTLLARRFFIPFIWGAGFLGGLILTLVNSPTLQFIFHENYSAVLMLIPLLCAGLIALSEYLLRKDEFTRAFQYWMFLGGLVALFSSEMQSYSAISSHYLIAYVPGYCLAILISIFIGQLREYSTLQKRLLFLILGVFLISCHLSLFQIASFIPFLFTIAVLFLISLFLASLQKRRLFEICLILIGSRVVIFYFEIFKNLAFTGLGLIILGCLLIGSVFFWNKYRIRFAARAEGWFK
jgi:uncharacterized membrane protein